MRSGALLPSKTCRSDSWRSPSTQWRVRAALPQCLKWAKRAHPAERPATSEPGWRVSLRTWASLLLSCGRGRSSKALSAIRLPTAANFKDIVSLQCVSSAQGHLVQKQVLQKSPLWRCGICHTPATQKCGGRHRGGSDKFQAPPLVQIVSKVHQSSRMLWQSMHFRTELFFGSTLGSLEARQGRPLRIR